MRKQNRRLRVCPNHSTTHTLGASIGAMFGIIAGTDKTIQIEGMPSATIKAYLKELRKKARIRDYK